MDFWAPLCDCAGIMQCCACALITKCFFPLITQCCGCASKLLLNIVKVFSAEHLVLLISLQLGRRISSLKFREIGPELTEETGNICCREIWTHSGNTTLQYKHKFDLILLCFSFCVVPVCFKLMANISPTLTTGHDTKTVASLVANISPSPT